MLSSLKTDKNISMYSGYVEMKRSTKDVENGTEPNSGICSCHERQSRAFEQHFDRYWHVSWVRGDFKLNLKGRKEDGVITPKQTIIWLKMQIDKQRAGAQLVLEYINIRLHHRVA